jgi:cephalosporin hydroxylase
MQKKMLSREEFEKKRNTAAKKMAEDKELQKNALDLLIRADHHSWIHQTTWFGEPILNLPQDMFALQEIIYKTRPRYIIEVGVAWGGALLFYSTLMQVLGGTGIIGIDIYIPNDLIKRIKSHKSLAERIHLINESSVEEDTFKKVKAIVGSCRDVMVVLDSFHTQEHVLRELELYSPLVGKGHYIVVGDTIVEDIPVQEHRPRPWGPGNNPKTACQAFFRKSKRFAIDKSIENKLLFTCNPGGYLQCKKDL